MISEEYNWIVSRIKMGKYDNAALLTDYVFSFMTEEEYTILLRMIRLYELQS